MFGEKQGFCPQRGIQVLTNGPTNDAILRLAAMLTLHGDPKLTMTSQFPQKVSTDFSQIRLLQNIRRGEKENELVFFRKLTLLKTKLIVTFSSGVSDAE